MDIQQLRLLLVLAERRNFTETAYDCAISQSSLSKHLMKAENELGGVHLFDCSTRPVFPTKEGEVFLTAARQMVDIYDNMVLLLEEMHDESCSMLRIGSIPVMGRLSVSTMIKEFRQSLSSAADIEIVDYGYTDVIAIPFQPEIYTDIVLVTRNEKPSPLLRQFIKRIISHWRYIYCEYS